MKHVILTGATLLALAANAQETHFTPGKLAVLRAGDGTFDLQLKQAPIFVDEFNPDAMNSAPVFTVRIPTNGPGSFFFNGHAATEGVLTRSADQHLLTFAGYGGADLLQDSGTAARLDISHGITTVDAAGNVHSILYKFDPASGKVNARGAVTDGANNFWGCGNTGGTFYFSPAQTHAPTPFDNFENCRTLKIINHVLYGSINAADGYVTEQTPGLYNFLPAALPQDTNAAPVLFLASSPDYKKVAGFDLNPAGTIAYLADVKAGIQKHVKSGNDWKFAYNFSIPQNIPADQNTSTGCFAVTVDFSQTSPIIYATTTEGYGGSVNSNRVVRIVDTGANAAVTTIAQAPGTNMVYRGIEFTPN